MNFDIAIGRLLKSEGGYVNNPNDPGGETNWGIAKRNHPNVDIRNLTRDGAIAIYKAEFWDLLDCSSFPPGLGFQLLDFAVNSGISTATRKLQAALGVADDGHWGPISAAALRTSNPIRVTLKFVAARGRFWARLSTFVTFGAGWMNRLCDDLEYLGIDLTS